MTVHLVRRTLAGRLTTIAFALFSLALLAGCNPRARKDAEALAKSTVKASTAYSEYQAGVLADYDRLTVTRVIENGSPLTPEDRHLRHGVLEALRTRAALANQLLDMATAASDLLNYSPEEAQKAARVLADRIADVNHHPFTIPVAFSQFLPDDKKDPKKYLDDAVSALVAVESLKEYRRALPKIREAITDIALFFESERYAYALYNAERLSRDFLIVERAKNNGLTVDLAFVQPTFDIFDLKYIATPIPPGTAPQLQSGITGAIGEMLHTKVVQRIAGNDAVAARLFQAQRELDRATNSTPVYLHFKADDFKTNIEGVVQRINAAIDFSPGPGQRIPEMMRVAKSVASRLSKADKAALKSSQLSAIQKAEIVAGAANDAVSGPAMFPIQIAVLDSKTLVADDAPAPDFPAAVVLATRFVQYSGPDRTVGTTSTRQYFIPIPPAGNTLAGIHYTLIKSDLNQ